MLKKDSRPRSCSGRLHFLPPELAAELAQPRLFFPIEGAEKLSNGRCMFREDLPYQELPSGRQGHDLYALVLGRWLTLGKSLFFKVSGHHGQVSASGKDLFGDVRERHRSQVVERFQYCELGEGQPRIAQTAG